MVDAEVRFEKLVMVRPQGESNPCYRRERAMS